MYVGVQQPTALLLLGLTFGAAAKLNCVGNTYPNGHRCCHECQPGEWPVNYDTCKECTQCNQRSGSELKQNCTPTQDTVCHCRSGTQPWQDSSHKTGVDCVPCPPGHFSPGNNQACKPWTNCTLSGRWSQRPASDRSFLTTLLWETQGPTVRPTTAQFTTVWPRTSRSPSTPSLEAPRGPALAAVLGLGLGLLAPLTALLALHLLQKAWKLMPSLPSPTFLLLGGNSFRTPIQEEQADTHFTLAKI
uniref:Tumor necrosis factor receptor superfamily, member 4 n=1 Tax=Nannospalax galili TaxID=1026970 RepID=A0A8C6REN9_NANGA